MTIISNLPFTLQNGQTADATQVMANFDEILNDVNNNAAHNGVNADITALSALVIPITPTQGGSNVFVGGTSTGTANAQVVASPVPMGFALTAGDRIVFIAGFTNTGAATLNVNGTGAVAINKSTENGLFALTGSEIIASSVVEAIYTGAVFELLSNTTPNGGFGLAVSVAAAATVDLGVVAPAHDLFITAGAGAISSFGSSAVLPYPIYLVRFSTSVTLSYNATSMILPGSSDIAAVTGDMAIAAYLGSGNWRVISYQKANGQPLSFSAGFLQNYLTGLTLSAAGGTGTFGVAAGEATDSTNANVMLLASAYTKTTASWTVGSGNGGLDTGSIATGTWYHVYLIKRVDTGVTDILFSLDSAGPTLPTNYTLKRRIGAMKTDGSSQWRAFTQTGDTFLWNTVVADVSNATVVSSLTNTALTVPTQIVVAALIRASLNATTGTSGKLVAVSETDQAVSTNQNTNIQASNNSITAGQYEIMTNTAQQIAVRFSTASAATYTIDTYGWKDTRGKLG